MSSPPDPERAFSLCIAQLESGSSEAQVSLQVLIKSFPDYSEGWAKLGKSLFKAGQIAGAAVAFKRAATISNNPIHHFQEAMTLMRLLRHREAISSFRTGLDKDPKNGEALLSVAKCLRSIGEFRDAYQTLLHAQTLEPQNWQVVFALGLLCEDLKDSKGAILAYSRCICLKPETAEAHLNLGLVYQNRGDWDQALQSYRHAYRLQPNTFGRVAQSLTSAAQGQMWLNLTKLKKSLSV